MKWLALLLLLGRTAYAQFTEVMEVRVTNVDVIVTKDGRHVTGLTRDDFEIFENGVRKEISNFLEIREERDPGVAPAAPAGDRAEASIATIRPRSIIVFVDEAALDAMRRNAVLPHLKAFLGKHARPSDRVSLVTWNRGLEVVLEPTNEAFKIGDAIESLEKRATYGGERAIEREQYFASIRDLIGIYAQRGEKPPFSAGLAIARAYAEKQLYDVRTRTEALRSVLTASRSEPGRKAMVLLTRALSTNPAEEAFVHLDTIRDAFADPAGTAMMDARQFTLPSLVTELAQAANSAGVTLYPIDPSGKGAGLRETDASSNESVQPRGVFATDTSLAALMGIAAETGGTASVGTTNYELAFDTIASDLSTYYSLGYRSTGERADRRNRVEVKLKKKGYAVRSRTAVIEQSVASEMQDAVTANLFRPAPENELQVRASAGEPSSRGGESVAIPLTVKFPTEGLTLVPEGNDVAGTFAVHVAFLRNDGAISRVERKLYPLRIPAESLPRRREITVQFEVIADSRTNAISVGVIDETSRATGFASVNLVR